jgi:hypothetical protein
VHRKTIILDYLIGIVKGNEVELDLSNSSYNNFLTDLLQENKYDIFKTLYIDLGFTKNNYNIIGILGYQKERLDSWIAQIKTENRDDVINEILD